MATKKIRKITNMKRGVHVQLKGIESFMDTFDATGPIAEIQLIFRIDKLDNCYSEYKELHKELVELVAELEDTTELDKFSEEYQQFEEGYFTIKSQMQLLLNQSKPQTSDNKIKSQPIGDKIDSLRLPKLKLPEFDGSLENWTKFKDSFQSMIINNVNISDIQRYHYLDGSLKLGARTCIEKVDISSEGFVLAWNALTARYDNPRAIVEKHISELFKLKTIIKESAIELRKLSDDCGVHISALERQGQNVKAWDMILVYIVTQKLDKDSRRAWEGTIEAGKLPTWEQLHLFLQSRCRVLESVECNKLRDISFSVKLPFNISQAKLSQKAFVNQTDPDICRLCNGNHFIAHCQHFLNLTPNDRYSEVRNNRLCLNCLRPNHGVLDCSSFHTCKTCQRKHHTLLHMGPQLHYSDNTNNLNKNSNQQLRKFKSSNSYSKNNTNQVHSNQHRPFNNSKPQPIRSNENVSSSNKQQNYENSGQCMCNISNYIADVDCTQVPVSSTTQQIMNNSANIQHPGNVGNVNSDVGTSESEAKFHSNTLTCHVDNSIVSQQKQVLLSTVLILIADYKGKFHLCRALFDSASQNNFISQDLSDRLNLHTNSFQMSVSGLNHNVTKINKKLSTLIKSRVDKFVQTLECLVVPQITNYLPNSFINISRWSIPTNVDLADYTFNQPNKIDLLIGAELFFKVLLPDRIELAFNLPILQKTKFGWIVSGGFYVNPQHYSLTAQDFCHLDNGSNSNNFFLSQEGDSFDIKLDEQLAKFFQTESITENDKPTLSLEEKYCEKHFAETYKRDDTGRFVVSLPFKDLISGIGNSRAMALKRFKSVESKLSRNADLRTSYIDYMREYERLGHMTLCDSNDYSASEYFLPHHAVFKPSSSTTRLRVVYDASAKGSNNLSLNDCLMVGPVIQQELFNIVLRFRKYLHVFTADVEKMYRMILVDPKYTNYQKIFWRENENHPIKEYKLQTVTFGTSSAPYLAIKSLQQLALDDGNKYPLARKVILSDFYVDDVLSGSNDLEICKETIRQLNQILLSAGMKLRKWSSNRHELLENIPDCDVEDMSNKINDTIKTLGLSWTPTTDEFMFSIEDVDQNNCDILTKRLVLTNISKIFDPLGLLAPTIIVAKILMQKLWLAKVGWDERIPSILESEYLEFQNNLYCLNNIKLNRCVIPNSAGRIELHGFADASSSAYGACLYIKSINVATGKVAIHLLCSKSRVAPLKTLSIPRLELNAALLLARLTDKALKAMDIVFSRIVLWSDSSITLSWIQLPPNQLKMYVANRVCEIQEITHTMEWRHVTSKCNPADLVSRGVMPHQLGSMKLWWNGPLFLNHAENNWPSRFREIKFEHLPDLKNDKTSVFVNTSFENIIDIHRFSSFERLNRITARVLRFVYNVRCKLKFDRRFGELQPIELLEASKCLIKMVQYVEFQSDIQHLQFKNCLSKKSPLVSLTPFLDSEGLLRVGGRLSNSSLPYDIKHQLLLPKHHFTELVIRHHHIENFHSGVECTLAAVRQLYWPLNGKNITKRVLRKCVICFRNRPRQLQQIMGNLPEGRVEKCRPFNITGMDFCGPFHIKYRNQRKDILHKVYVCIFICFAIKAIHLEVVEDFTSASFIACLKRFLARRGKVSTIWCDNGSNFIGAKNELSKTYKMLKEQNDEISRFLFNQSIDWKLIPPRSPHFGGLWEANVKIFKTHFKRIVGNITLTLEQIYTIVVQVEGIMNSRPLTLVSTDPHDPEPLTPGHFLTGGAINSIIEHDITNTPANRLSYWKVTTQMIQHFWKRFAREYIHTLQQKKKWQSIIDDVKIGDIVLVHDDNLPPTQWMLGRVIQAIRGQDDRVRVAVVRTKTGVAKRAIHKLAKLPIE